VTGSSGLPLVGAEVVLLGTQVFNANVTSVAKQILSLRPAFAAVEAANATGVERMAAWSDAATKASRALSGSYLQDFAKQSRAAAIEAERVAVNSGKMAVAFRADAVSLTDYAKFARSYADATKGSATEARDAVEAEQAAAAAINATKLARQTATEATRAADQATAAFLKAEADAAKSTQQVLAAATQAEADYLASLRNQIKLTEDARKAQFAAIGVGVAAVGVALAAAVLVSENAAAQYNQQLTAIGAISDATVAQIEHLGQAQLELSRHSTQAAGQLGLASKELVKAGFDIEKVTGVTLDAVNNLIVASDGELKAADAALTAQVGTAAFGNTVTEVADAATTAVQRSTLTFTGYADALRQAGLVAAKGGLDINEFSAAVAVAGKTISSGTEIGTGFRQMFVRLQDPSAENIALMKEYNISLYNAAGQVRPFRDVLVSLETAFGKQAIASGKLTEAQRDQALASLFSTRSIRPVIALIEGGTVAYDAFTDANKRLTASDVAGKMLTPTQAQAKILKNNIDALTISFGQGLDPAVKNVTTSMNTFLQSLDLDHVRRFGEAISLIGRVIGTEVQGFGRGGIVGLITEPVAGLEEFFGLVQDTGTKAVTDYTIAVSHLNTWLATGDITQQQYTEGIAKAAAAYSKATDSVKNYGMALDQAERHPGGVGATSTSTGAGAGGLGFPGPSAKDVADAQAKATAINQDFNRAIAKETENTTNNINKLYRDTYEAIAKATEENAAEVAKANADAAKQIADAESAETVKKDQEVRRAALEQRLKDEDEARKETRQAEDDANKRDTEDRKNALQQQTKDAEDAFKRQQDDETNSNKERLAGVEAEVKAEQQVREEALKGIQDAEDAAAKRRQENEDAALRDRQRDTETALKDIQRIETDALKQHQDDLARSLKADEDAREQSLKNTFEIENKRLDLEHQLQDVVTKDQRDRAQAEYEYQQDIQRGVKESIAQERLQRKLGDIAQATGQARVKIADQSQQTQETLNVQQDQQRRETALRATFDQEQLAQRRAFEAAAAKLEADHEAATLALRKRTEAETLKARQATEDETDRVRRVHEEQRNALAEAFRKEDLARAQKNEQDEVAFKRQQEDAYSGYRLGLEQAELAAMRLIEDEDAKRRLAREQDDIRIQAQQAAQRLALQKQFDDEDLARRIANIYKERDERIRAANEAFEKQRENLRRQLANEVNDLRISLQERLDAIRRDYTDKLADLVSSAGDAVRPYVDSIESAMRSALNNVITSADAATNAIIRAYNAEGQLHVLMSQRPPTPPPAPLPPGSVQGVPNDQAPPNTLTPGYQYGGEVPGPFGSPQWVLAHGGERYAGIGMYGNTLTSVLMAESMAQRGIGGSSHISNQYSYTVHANYGRTQTEGSVRRDLSALVMLTRG
jgi:TP901 family phage tail tape measure protein